MEEILEATECIGDVAVSRANPNDAAENGGYLWLVTFLRDADSPCEQVLLILCPADIEIELHLATTRSRSTHIAAGIK